MPRPRLPVLVRDPGSEGAAAAVRAVVQAELGPAELRRHMEGPDQFHAGLWARLEPMLAVLGGGVAGLAAAFEEMGRAVAMTPALGAVLAQVAGGGEAAATPRGALGFSEDELGWHPEDLATRAECDRAGGWRLTGTKTAVLDAGTAPTLTVAAAAPDGVGLFAVDADAPGLTVEDVPGLDQTRRLATMGLRSTPARLLASGAAATRAVTHALDVGATVLAAEQVGGAQRCLELTVDHVGHRRQFDRPVGSFQAVKHRCAEVMVTVELARSAALAAAWAADHDRDGFGVAAATARIACSEAYMEAARTCMQLHGARALTWDHEAHLHLKRAKSSAMVLGTGDYWSRLLAERLGL